MNDSDEHARRFREAAHQMAISKTVIWNCVNCGEENRGDRHHCWKCGTNQDGTLAKTHQKGSVDLPIREAHVTPQVKSTVSASASQISKPGSEFGIGNAIQTNLRQRYEYRMVQIPPSITVRQAIGNEAAFYLQRVVNEEASRGWEFMRVDTIGVNTTPGCLAGLFGGQVTTLNYYAVTFRRETASQAAEDRR